VDAAIDHSLSSNKDYDLKLVMKGSAVSITVNGQMVTSFGFNAPIVDGDVGLVTRGGDSAFDSFDLRTNDPAFEEESAAAAALAIDQDTIPNDPLDVNNDGHVTPLDALLIINELGQGGLATAQSSRFDVSGDRSVTPLDALLIINELDLRNQVAAKIAADVDAELGLTRRTTLAETDRVFDRLAADRDLESTLSAIADEIAVVEEDDENAVDRLFGDSDHLLRNDWRTF
jgi:hypothetical protein